MEIHQIREQIEILYTFIDMSSDFGVDESGNLFAIVDGFPIELEGISDEAIEVPFE